MPEESQRSEFWKNPPRSVFLMDLTPPVYSFKTFASESYTVSPPL